jgi:hypothetical protein
MKYKFIHLSKNCCIPDSDRSDINLWNSSLVTWALRNVNARFEDLCFAVSRSGMEGSSSKYKFSITTFKRTVEQLFVFGSHMFRAKIGSY